MKIPLNQRSVSDYTRQAVKFNTRKLEVKLFWWLLTLKHLCEKSLDVVRVDYLFVKILHLKYI